MERLVQSLKEDFKKVYWFFSPGLLFSLLLGQIRTVYFSLSLTALSLLIYIVCTLLIENTKLKWGLYVVLTFMSGFVLFYIFEGGQQQSSAKDISSKPAITAENTSVYKTVTANMKSVTPEEYLEVLATGDSTILYVGRETCPYCSDFINRVSSLDLSMVYYMDTEEKTDALYAFADRYKIDAIPQLLRFQNAEIAERFDIRPTVSPDEVASFIHD